MFTEANAYEQFMGRWSRLIAPVFIEFARIPDLGRVLDVGCGTGALAFTIASLRPRCNVIGIDASREYIRSAESQNPSSATVHVKVGNAQSLEFPDSTFDCSVSLFALNFIPDALKGAYEMVRVTRPGGRAAAAVWDYGGSMEMLRIFWDAAAALDAGAEKFDEKMMPLCRAGELSGLFRSVGLHDVHEQSLEAELKFKSFPDYWEPFLLGQGPAGAYVKYIGADRASVLRQKVKSQLGLEDETIPFALRGRLWAVRGTISESKSK